MSIPNVVDGTSNSHSAPTLGAVAFATALVAGVTGYYIGMGASVGVFTFNKDNATETTKKTRKEIGPMASESKNGSSETEDESSGSEDDSDEEDEKLDLATFENNRDEVKLVLVVRTDLGMTKGLFFIYTFFLFALVSSFPDYTKNKRDQPGLAVSVIFDAPPLRRPSVFS